jgi:hypothetical protein
LDVVEEAGELPLGVGEVIGGMNLRDCNDQGSLQGGERQGLVEVASQVPAAQAAGEDLQEHGQIDELAAKADGSDVRAPDLIRPDNFQVFDEVGIAREGMVAGGGAWPA